MSKEDKDTIGPGLYKFLEGRTTIEPTAEELEKYNDIRSIIQDLWEKQPPPKYEIFFTTESYKLFQDYVTELYKNESKR